MCSFFFRCSNLCCSRKRKYKSNKWGLGYYSWEDCSKYKLLEYENSLNKEKNELTQQKEGSHPAKTNIQNQLAEDELEQKAISIFSDKINLMLEEIHSINKEFNRSERNSEKKSIRGTLEMLKNLKSEKNKEKSGKRKAYER